MKDINSRDLVTSKFAYVRYILNLSKEQCSLPEPLGSVGLLLMHDAIEMTLNLSALYLGLNVPDKFMQYWETFKNAKIELGYKSPMEGLNKARVALKHNGTFPNKAELLGFLVLAEAFISENVLKIFEVELESITLSAMVEYEPVREHLQNAESKLKDSPAIALEEIAIAFTLFIDYFHAKHSSYGRNAFQQIPRLRNSSNRDDRLESTLESHKKAIEAIDETLEILMLGIDYIQYSKYRLCVPKITGLMNGELRVQPWRVDEPTSESAQFAHTFVIEQILRLQRRAFETRLETGYLVIASHLEKDKTTLYARQPYHVDGYVLIQNKSSDSKDTLADA